MHFTAAQLDEMQDQINQAPTYSAPYSMMSRSENLPTGSKSLLSYLPYTPSARDQGSCGNCWVWASTGALEVDHRIKTGSNDQLSVQYFNSKYQNGGGSNGACCGGWLSSFTTWYNADKTVIPLSNTNAGFGDSHSQCGYSTAVPVNTISTKPNYRINTIQSSTIATFGQGQSTAINNIKSALNANKAVVYSFYYGTNGWNAFYNFWDLSNETAVFDPALYTSTTQNGGHAVLIVGYDDSNAGNPYWIVLNSWGAPANRPHGLFRVKMNMDYSTTYTYSGHSYQQHTFQMLDSTFSILPLPGYTNPPTDPDHDGVYEDLNGNGRLDFADVVLYFNQMEWIAAYEPVNAFDFNGNSRIDFADIVKLFGEI